MTTQRVKTRKSKEESTRLRQRAWELFELGKSQQDIAREIGVSQPTVSTYLRGERNQKADAAEARSRGDGAAKEFVETALSEGELNAEIARLAELPRGLYAQRRKAEAKRLGITLAELDSLVKAQRAKKAQKPAAPQFDPVELERSASHIIKHPDILNLFAKEFAKVVAGETANGKLLYLVATSRLFDKPMHAAIKGTSAGGKSEIRKRVLTFFPPESVIAFTSLSEKSLLYHDGDYTNMILSMGEALGDDEQKLQDMFLRELMSEGRLRHISVQKVDGNLEQLIIEKNGPVSFLVTTTKNKLHPENETRMLSLEIDDSENQTRKVLDKVALIDGLHDTAAVDYKPWQDFQRWLAAGERRVVVPYALALSGLIPPAAVRLRRDFGQVIRAIAAHALLHRDQRDRDGAGRIVADINRDYEAVRKLLNAIVAEGSGVAVSEAMAKTIDAVAKATIGMTEAEGANAKDIAKLLKLDHSATWRRLTAARYDGYIVNLEQRKGMAGKYRASGQKPEPIEILPTAQNLYEKHSHATPPKTVQSCNRNEITDISLRDTDCSDDCNPIADCSSRLHDCSPIANGPTIDNALDGNVKSLPIARLQRFSGGTAAHKNNKNNDAAPEYFPPVCEYCGAPEAPGNPVQLCAVESEEFLLHRECRDAWQKKDKEGHRHE